MNETNPLSQYFRTPGLHVVLPSRGAFTPKEDLETSINGELAVFPMTAKDDVWAKNPDGLLNGYSIENIIRSCVPGVKNPRKMPAQDIDYLLLAIKKATYGDKLTITGRCPVCNNEHDYEISIDEIMSSARTLEPEYSVRLCDELIAKIKPYDYAASTKTNLAAFEETKLLQALMTANVPEEMRIKVFSDSFEKVATLNLDLIADSVMSIVTPSDEVKDPNFIRGFIENAPSDIVKKLNDAMLVFKDTGIDRSIHLTCHTEGCGNEWTTELLFDPSHFFE